MVLAVGVQRRAKQRIQVCVTSGRVARVEEALDWATKVQTTYLLLPGTCELARYLSCGAYAE